MKLAPKKYTRRKVACIPAWADRILLVLNGIDGWPPALPAEITVKEFIKQSKHMQSQEGAGEWGVLVYAAEAGAQTCRRHPYGKDNPYAVLRRKPGTQGRVRRVAYWDYMRWTEFKFKQPKETQ